MKCIIFVETTRCISCRGGLGVRFRDDKKVA